MDFCRVPSNADIAGVGVRIAVYIQALLATINAILQEGDSQDITGSPRSESPTEDGTRADLEAIRGPRSSNTEEMRNSKEIRTSGYSMESEVVSSLPTDPSVGEPGATSGNVSSGNPQPQRQRGTTQYGDRQTTIPAASNVALRGALPPLVIPTASASRPPRASALRYAENTRYGFKSPGAYSSNSRISVPRRSLSRSVINCILSPQFARNADRDLEWSLFVTGSAIITCAMIQAFSKDSGGLTDFHALVVLNLSSINYWAGIDLLRRRTSGNDPKDRRRWKMFSIPFRNWWDALRTIDSWLPFYLHATLFSVFGIIFWLRQDLFHRYFDAQGCTTPTVYWAFLSIPVGNPVLKVASLVFYFLSVVPGLNGLFTQFFSWFIAGLLAIALAIVALVFLVPAYVLLLFWGTLPAYVPQPHLAGFHEKGDFVFVDHLPKYEVLLKMLESPYRRGSTVVYMAPVLYWIIATEKLVQSNKPFARDDSGNDNTNHSQWTYGQVMSLMTAAVAVLLYCRQVKDKIMEELDGRPKIAPPSQMAQQEAERTAEGGESGPNEGDMGLRTDNSPASTGDLGSGHRMDMPQPQPFFVMPIQPAVHPPSPHRRAA